MRRIRNTFDELNPSRHWKFECPYLKHNLKISTESSFHVFYQIDISDIKNILRCEAWHYTKAGSTDQLDHRETITRWVDWQRVSTDEFP